MQLKVTVTFLISILFSFLKPQETRTPLAKPHCQKECGDIIIPYPFGIGAGCYLDKAFEVLCIPIFPKVPLLVFLDGSAISHISLDHAVVQVERQPNVYCYNKSGEDPSTSVSVHLNQQFSISYTRNKFVAIGCDIFAYIIDSGSRNYTSGCASLCDDPNPIVGLTATSCSSVGCCQTTLPKDITSFHMQIFSINTFNRSWTTKPCSIAFLVDKDFSGYTFNISEHIHPDFYAFPTVYNWVIGNITFHEARERGNLVCSINSDCIDNAEGLGYWCHCKHGYQGNPYLPSGCQDINECEDPNTSPCQNGAVCFNTPGNYSCRCPIGLVSDGNEPGDGCTHKKARHRIYVAVSLATTSAAGALILIAFGSLLYLKLKRLRRNNVKQKFFKRNGGLVLQELITSSTASALKTKLFSTKEIMKAIDNFNESRVLGKGGQGTVYKGMLPDGSIVAVKKSNIVDEDQVGRFVNEVLILSQINHRNIVKLLGCCLEYEVPLLVYEYVSNGNLSHHIRNEGGVPKLSWESRLQIAGEVAGALSYLHSCASTAIFHRDIKSDNILLDENYRAVVSDFGLSRTISLGKTHLTVMVGGTFGYLDPDYFRSGQFTEKSDVYAFGVVLAELLTGRKAISSSSSDEGLVNYFQALMKQNSPFEIHDALVANDHDGQIGEILAVAKLAQRCLHWNTKKRPIMKEVAAVLYQLRRKQYRPPSPKKLKGQLLLIKERIQYT
ncbi:hypothetical protein RJ639_044521 [Escallonia herrerae]|uniref:Uncharacterized protein n=1 Tax=Escallonia herrerae TaxID=1293975 RepID=A0AA88WD67_9ASTE|nr:hypothetical protein RJ639_044521 [Escallonia herrerae]